VKLKNILIIILLVLATTSTSACIYLEPSKNVEITLKTNGSDVQVETSNTFFFFDTVPISMKREMANKALDDIYSDTSTVESIKNDMQEIAEVYGYNVTVTIDSQFGTDQLPMVATVNGTSMVPTLQNGQNVVLVKTKDFKVGDIVVARHPEHGLIVKRVAQIKGDQVYLMSDNREVVITNNYIIKGLDTWLPIENVVGVVQDINT
jgi:hypothetical protein